MMHHVDHAELETALLDLETRLSRDLEAKHNWWRDRLRSALALAGRAMNDIRVLRTQLENLTMPLADQIGQLQGVAADLASTLSAYEQAVHTWKAAHDDGVDTANAQAQLDAASSGVAAVTQSLTDSLEGLKTAVAEVQPEPTAAPVLPTLPTQDGGTVGQTQVQPPAAPGGAAQFPGTPSGAGNDTIGNPAAGVPDNAAGTGPTAIPGGAQLNPFATPDNPNVPADGSDSAASTDGSGASATDTSGAGATTTSPSTPSSTDTSSPSSTTAASPSTTSDSSSTTSSTSTSASTDSGSGSGSGATSGSGSSSS